MMLDSKSLVVLGFCAWTEAFVPPAPFVSVVHTRTSTTTLSAVPPGWVGGFAQSDKDFAYPNPNLSSPPVLGNMDNIDKLDRMQKVKWPEFTWLTKPGDESSRCYQTFATNISRLGYTKEGRVYSIICPQAGYGTDRLGNLNIEVTVTGQRGWADEPKKTMAADMSVTGVIWFSSGSKEITLVKLLEIILSLFGPFPFKKEHAIDVTTHRVAQPNQPIFPVLSGTTKNISVPEFAKHWDDGAYGVGTVDVAIGAIKKQTSIIVDRFNQFVLDIFNLASGNILKEGSVLTWDVWFAEPELVDRKEWREHAKRWRKSLEVDHASPDGDAKPPRYFDGRPFTPFKSQLARYKSEFRSASKPELHFECAREEERLIKEFRDYLKENRAELEQQFDATRGADVQRDAFMEGEEDLDSLLSKLDAEIDKW